MYFIRIQKLTFLEHTLNQQSVKFQHIILNFRVSKEIGLPILSISLFGVGGGGGDRGIGCASH